MSKHRLRIFVFVNDPPTIGENRRIGDWRS